MVEQNESEFYPAPSCKDGMRPECKACIKLARQAYQKTDAYKIAQKGRHLKFAWGITEQEYLEILEEQHFCCPLCEKHQDNFEKRLSFDHDHKTGIFRGLLCGSCNTKLEWLIDNENKINKYLRR